MQSLKKRGNGAVGGENEGSYAICPYIFATCRKNSNIFNVESKILPSQHLTSF